MNFPAPKLLVKRATGLYVGEAKIVVSVVAGSPWGARDVASFEVPSGRSGALDTLRELATDPRLEGTLSVGFDPRREFSVALRATAADDARSASDLVTARLGKLDGGVVAAQSTLRGPRARWTTVTALPRKIATQAFDTLASCGHERVLLPIAPALHRVALQKQRAPRRWRTSIRIIPGSGRGLAILEIGAHAVAWRLFPASNDDPIGTISGAALMLATQAAQELGVEEIDGILFHCGEQHGAIAHQCEQAIGRPVKAVEAMRLDEPTIARALAVGALAHHRGDVNLFRELLPEPGFKQNFPGAAVAMIGAVTLSAAGVLQVEAMRCSDTAARLEQKVRGDSAGRSPRRKELEAVRDRLKSDVQHAHSFIVDRTHWAPLLKEVPGLLPPTLTLTEFDGRSALKGFGDDRPAAGGKRAIIQGEVPFDGESSSPPEVGILTSRVVASPAFQSTFPDVTGAKVRMKPGSGQALAKILVLCMPHGG
jgi:hypothetical protein